VAAKLSLFLEPETKCTKRQFMKQDHKDPIYVVITGGSKGIGRAICEKLAKQGCHISTCSRTMSELQALKMDLEQLGAQVYVEKADVSNRMELESFATNVLKEVPRVDILINNAGVFHPGSILTEEEGELDLMMQTNLYSAYQLTRALIPAVRKSAKGHIFNVCSIASKIAYPNGGSYSISKFAMLGFSKVLREELKTEKVRVTAILPGATWSDSWKGVDLPRERLMEAQDIAHMLWSSYELSPAADVEEITIRPQLGDL